MRRSKRRRGRKRREDPFVEVEAEAKGDTTRHDLVELLSSNERDFLLRRNHNNGFDDQVQISSLKGHKTVMIYSLGKYFAEDIIIPLLLDLYPRLASNDIEVVMVPAEDDNKPPDPRIPWLAVPQSDSKAVRDRLRGTIVIYGSNLAILDKSGRVVMRRANEAIAFYGVEAYPFTRDKILSLNVREAGAKRNQSIDFLVSGTRDNIPASRLVGKTVALVFVCYWPHDQTFMDLLVRVYNQLKDKDKEFEVVLIPAADVLHEDRFEEIINSMPWSFLPLRDKQRAQKLFLYFSCDRRRLPELSVPLSPRVYIIGPDGKTVYIDGARSIRLFGAEAFPFTPQKLYQLELKAKQGQWTWETLLAFHGRDFVIRKDGSKVSVSELYGKTVFLNFEIRRPHEGKVMESCRGIREKHGAGVFEVICIGYTEEDLDELDEWMLALPPDDPRQFRLEYLFNMTSPKPVVLDSCCRILTSDANDIIGIHGADAYPFSEDHLRRITRRAEEIAESWPETVKHEVHRHEIRRVPCGLNYCEGCYWSKNRWNFICTHSSSCFDLHRNYDFGPEYEGGKLGGRSLMDSFITSSFEC